MAYFGFWLTGREEGLFYLFLGHCIVIIDSPHANLESQGCNRH